MKIFLSPHLFRKLACLSESSSMLCARVKTIGLIVTLSLFASVAFSQSVSGPSSACADQPVNFYFIAGCAGSYVSQGGWRINPMPDSYQFFTTAGGYTSLSATWSSNTVGSGRSVTVSVDYSCTTSSGTVILSPPLTLNPATAASVTLSTSVASICKTSASPIRFTATPTGGGTSPNYNFTVDGTTVYTGTSNFYDYSVANLTAGTHTAGVSMTSALPCASPKPTSFVTQTFTVTAPSSYTVSLTPAGTVCSSSTSQVETATVTGGVGTLTYQWYKDGLLVNTTTTNSSTYINLIDGNSFYCRVSSNASCVVSPVQSPTTTYHTNPVTTIAPGSAVKVCSTCSQIFSDPTPANSGTAHVWKKNGTVISGVNGATYTASQAGTYSYTLTNAGGCTASSAGVALTLNVPPVANAGTNKTVNLPVNSVTLTGSGTDADGTITAYLWQQVSGPSTVTLTGANTTTLTASDLVAGTYTFTLRVTDNTSENSPLSTVTVTVVPIPNNFNFVVQSTVLKENITTPAAVDALVIGDKNKVYQYFDGLGRPIQTVNVQFSPASAKNDLVQPIAYDVNGRQSLNYLPYTQGNDGYYKVDALATVGATGPDLDKYRTGKQYAFYQTGGLIAKDQYPYTQTTFEASPLNRRVKELGLGEAWVNNNKSVDVKYLLNQHGTGISDVQEKIINWQIDVSGKPVRAPVAGGVVTNGFYNTGQLSITVTTDEQGNTQREYTNKDGQLILRKIQAATGATANLNSNNLWALTYYIYDDFGNLRYVFSPEMSKLTQTDTYTPLDADILKWAYRYVYDGRKRMIEKWLPGADVIYMVYDPRDRLVMTQDGAQRAKTQQEWTVIKYDAFNRPIITGILPESGSDWDFTFVQGYVNNFYNNLAPGKAWFEDRGSDVFGYTNKSYPDQLLPSECLTVTYYDDYNFGNAVRKPSDYKYVADLTGLPATAQAKAKGLITGTRTKVLDGENYGEVQWLVSYNYYDDKYRPIQTVTDNYKGGRDRTSSVYDFVKLLKTQTTHESRAITWQNFVNTRMEGNKVVKTGGTNLTWGDAGASSLQTLAAGQNGWLEVTASEEYLHRMFGFSTQNPAGNPALIVHGLIMGNNELWIGENGTYTQITDYCVGDTLRIERTGAQIFYKKNGVAIRPPSTANAGALLAACSLNGTASTVAYAKASFENLTTTVYREFDYDHMNRVTNIWHKVGSNTKYVINHTNYNELGQAIEKRLHGTNATASDAKESIDYRYNIRGWLTSINDPVLLPRLFAEALKYVDPSANGGAAQYNGNISEIVWKNAGSFKQSYGYTYDAMDRLQDAHYFNLDVTGQTDRYRETIGTGTDGYDLNGNILKLSRNGKNATYTFGLMDNLTYTYTGNQLTRVDDAVAVNPQEQGFKELKKEADEYTYDKSGSMKADGNKGIISIDYTYLNQPRKVSKSISDYVTYVYDATGRKLFQQMFSSAGNRRTDYAGEFTYQNDSLKFAAHDEGRVILTSATPEYQYFLKDHLGNVRTTFSTTQETETATGTLENANATTEQSQFVRLVNVRKVQSVLFDHTNGAATGYAERLNGSANEKYGLARSISVMPGDVISMEVYAKYIDTNSGNRTAALNTLLAQIAAGTAPAGTVVDGSGYGTSTSSFPFPGLLNTAGSTGSGPKAYLNYLFFDRNFIFKNGGFKRLSPTPRETGNDVAHERLYFDNIPINEAGYMYIYLSNEESTPVEVFFDDLKVTQVKSTIIQQSDYYPFGLAVNSYNRENSVKQDYLYNGKELQDELNLGWLDYGARSYNPDLGRWTAIDPMGEKYYSLSPYNYAMNDPTLFVDPNGMDITLNGSAQDAMNFLMYLSTVTSNDYHWDADSKKVSIAESKSDDKKTDVISSDLDQLVNDLVQGDKKDKNVILNLISRNSSYKGLTSDDVFVDSFEAGVFDLQDLDDLDPSNEHTTPLIAGMIGHVLQERSIPDDYKSVIDAYEPSVEHPDYMRSHQQASIFESKVVQSYYQRLDGRDVTLEPFYSHEVNRATHTTINYSYGYQLNFQFVYPNGSGNTKNVTSKMNSIIRRKK